MTASELFCLAKWAQQWIGRNLAGSAMRVVASYSPTLVQAAITVCAVAEFVTLALYLVCEPVRVDFRLYGNRGSVKRRERDCGQCSGSSNGKR
jgi:hypothetical protein